MEGYLLALSKERHAQLWFCVLEHGALRCFTKPNGQLVDSIQLTRHHIRVVVSADTDDSVCPNQFTVSATEAQFDEATGVLRAANGNERLQCFAAPTAEVMRRWGRAIQGWRRRAFDAPEPARSKEDAVMRRKALRDEAQALLYFVTAFDLLLKLATPADKEPKKKPPIAFRRSLLPAKTSNQSATSSEKRDRQSLPSATGLSRLKILTAWMPPVPLPSWRRVRAFDPDEDQ